MTAPVNPVIVSYSPLHPFLHRLIRALPQDVVGEPILCDADALQPGSGLAGPRKPERDQARQRHCRAFIGHRAGSARPGQAPGGTP